MYSILQLRCWNSSVTILPVTIIKDQSQVPSSSPPSIGFPKPALTGNILPGPVFMNSQYDALSVRGNCILPSFCQICPQLRCCNQHNLPPWMSFECSYLNISGNWPEQEAFKLRALQASTRGPVQNEGAKNRTDSLKNYVTQRETRFRCSG